MTSLNIPHLRLNHQRIAEPRFTEAEAVVRWMGALQAQDYLQAVWAVGARMQTPALAKVEQAIAEGRIIRTWPMRGTIHFVPPEDAGWMLKLAVDRMIAGAKRRRQQLELDEHILGRSQEVLGSALQHGQPVSRAEVMKLLEGAGISTKGQRGYHILWHVAQIGAICIGPTQDKEQTFVLSEKWIPHSRTLSREEGLVELARRYFSSHGPARVQDFAWWSGLTLTDARAGLEGTKGKLISAKVNDREYWMSGDTPASYSRAVYLLAGFDEYLLGYTDRDAVLDPQRAQKVCPGSNGVFFPMIVRDGQVVGTWKRSFKKGSVVITHEAFSPLSEADTQAFETEAKRYGAFHGLPVVFD